jgi:hypothetical protein
MLPRKFGPRKSTGVRTRMTMATRHHLRRRPGWRCPLGRATTTASHESRSRNLAACAVLRSRKPLTMTATTSAVVTANGAAPCSGTLCLTSEPTSASSSTNKTARSFGIFESSPNVWGSLWEQRYGFEDASQRRRALSPPADAPGTSTQSSVGLRPLRCLLRPRLTPV